MDRFKGKGLGLQYLQKQDVETWLSAVKTKGYDPSRYLRDSEGIDYEFLEKQMEAWVI